MSRDEQPLLRDPLNAGKEKAERIVRKSAAKAVQIVWGDDDLRQKVISEAIRHMGDSPSTLNKWLKALEIPGIMQGSDYDGWVNRYYEAITSAIEGLVPERLITPSGPVEKIPNGLLWTESTGWVQRWK